jgi:hypothetical protein
MQADDQADAKVNPEIEKLNADIAERVRQLNTADLVELLQGRASSLIQADANHNQNQNE